MKIEKYLKNQMLMGIAYILGGVVALSTLVILIITGKAEGKAIGITTGITCGFLPLGIGLIWDSRRIRRNPALIKQIELKNEERNIYLRNKSGNEAFNFSIWLLMVLWLLNIWFDISLTMLFPIVLGLMALSYFIILGFNAKKY